MPRNLDADHNAGARLDVYDLVCPFVLPKVKPCGASAKAALGLMVRKLAPVGGVQGTRGLDLFLLLQYHLLNSM